MSFESETLRDKYFALQAEELKELLDPVTGMLSEKFSRRVPCPLCGSSEHAAIFVKRGYTFVRCAACGLVYTNPQVAAELVEAAYRGAEGKAACASTDMWMQILLNEKESAWRGQYFNGILDLVEDCRPDRGRLLDVGCAVGHFLSICRERGWDTTGIELSQKGYEHCTGKLGLNVVRAPLHEAGFPGGTFDAVSFLGVLEHIPDPVAVVREAVRCLKPGGAMAVIVPNMYSLLTMLLREKAVTFDGREHMIFFSMDCLRRMFEDVGLEVRYADTVLTGLDNILKYIQFMDPYQEDIGPPHLPRPLRPFFAEPTGRAALEKLILAHDLGLRLRMVGVKR